MSSSRASRRSIGEGPQPNRAVIDIGSNTVRLVVYSGSPRTPDVWLNEKVTAKLGRELSTTGRMPQKAVDLAMAGLARFAVILDDIGVANVQTVATAAVREAENGPEFLELVRGLGLQPRLLSGEQEACVSAMGVIGAFPKARGIVADLGGGSLELIPIENGSCHDGISLPLGTLRLPQLHERGEGALRKAVTAELKAADWVFDQARPLFMVGGTWRALAAFAMHRAKHPLSDPHGLRLTREEADKVCKKITGMTPEALSDISGISSSRAAGLPDAAAMLRVILAKLKPEGLVFSSWGLREGLLFEQLPQGLREQDPLLAGISAFVAPRGASPSIAAMIAAWTTDVVSPGNGGERLRLAATMLSLAAARIEPNLRLRHSTDWAMDKRWLALDHKGRAMITTALRASCGKPDIMPELLSLADEATLREAAGWGLAIRLCRRIGAGSRVSLMSSSLTKEDGCLVLRLDESREQLASDSVRSDLKNLANWMGLEHELRISSAEEVRRLSAV